MLNPSAAIRIMIFFRGLFFSNRCRFKDFFETALKSKVMPQQQKPERIIYLAQDDEDDRLLFLEAAAELNLPIRIVQAADGKELLGKVFNDFSSLKKNAEKFLQA
jgi:hypothetical protein